MVGFIIVVTYAFERIGSVARIGDVIYRRRSSATLVRPPGGGAVMTTYRVGHHIALVVSLVTRG